MSLKALSRKRIYALAVLGLLLVSALSVAFKFPPVSGGGSWWNADWPYRKTITVDHTKVSADLTNFPDFDKHNRYGLEGQGSGEWQRHSLHQTVWG